MRLKIILSKHAKIAITSRTIKAKSILTALKSPDEKFLGISINHTVIINRLAESR